MLPRPRWRCRCCSRPAGAYLLGRDLFHSRLAGWLVAVAFVFAPYHLIDTYVRAILSESWVFPWLPFLLWSLRRAVPGKLAAGGASRPAGGQRSFSPIT
ncbi:MAG: hypothetical protein KatS3mg061_1193 [Dehalococcoidia bacterium]|nr:MAG: hypothetical protein KatS3mg061_1193 [Dehalococcoidia bacterium]